MGNAHRGRGGDLQGGLRVSMRMVWRIISLIITWVLTGTSGVSAMSFITVEASNKIEGIVTTSTRMKQLFEEKVTQRNRDENEIVGYRDVLNIIHESKETVI